MGVDKPRNDRHTRQVENLCAIGGVELAFRPDVECRAAGETPLALPDTARDTPIVNPLPSDAGDTLHRSDPTSAWARISIPVDIDTLKSSHPDQARRWQQSVRTAFSLCLTNGYRVVGFVTSGEAAPFYVLTTEPWSGQEG